MLFLLDTNVVSDIVREHPKITARINALLPTDAVAICTIVRGELLFGIENVPAGKRRQLLSEKLAHILAALPCHAVPSSAADHYSRIKHACRQKGTPLDENDLWIAATTVSMHATLVTRDGDFGHVDGLITEDWTT